MICEIGEFEIHLHLCVWKLQAQVKSLFFAFSIPEQTITSRVIGMVEMENVPTCGKIIFFNIIQIKNTSANSEQQLVFLLSFPNMQLTIAAMINIIFMQMIRWLNLILNAKYDKSYSNRRPIPRT